MGSPGKDFEAIVPGSNILRRGLQDDRTNPSDCQPAGVDSQLLGTQTDTSRSIGPELQRDNSLAARHLASQFGLSGIVRPPHEAHGQWPDLADSSAAEAFDPAAVTFGPGGGSVSQALKTFIV